MKQILLSRTDSIGDVILTLPMAGVLKELHTEIKVHFLGKSYTKAIVSHSEYIDGFHNWDEIRDSNSYLSEIGFDAVIHVFPNSDIARVCKKSKIPLRVGTSHRVFHWWTCNKLLNFSRKKSNLHESQLNLKLLEPFGYNQVPSIGELSELIGWKQDNNESSLLPNNGKFNLVLHIKSRGSALEWSARNYLELARSLENEANIILTGTQEEGDLISNEIPDILTLPNIHSTLGKLSLDQLISLIGSSDGLVACSTGPLHIAAVSGIHTLGLYPNIKPMDAGRWGPIGANAHYIEGDARDGLLDISVSKVLESVRKWF